jgi:1,4-alpha-glucan branching enzyme
MRKGEKAGDYLLIIANASTQVLSNYQIGVPENISFFEILNTDDIRYGGGNVRNEHEIQAFGQNLHGRAFSVSLTLPPLALIVIKPQRTPARP